MNMKNSIGIVLALLVMCLPTTGLADKSDYIWNQQFAKKLGLAEQGDVKAQYDVGKMYQKGQGTARDPAEAFKWFSKAAEQGHERAEYKIGYLYHKGLGVTKNNDKAFEWVKKSADKNYGPAMFYLGQLYAAGAGTRRDLNKALGWYQKAAAKGYHPAKAAITSTKQQLARAEAAAPPPPPPPPAPVKRAAATPKPVAKKVTKPASPATTNLLASLIGSMWKHGSKPATEFPSKMTDCTVSNNRILCNSKEMEVQESFGTVTYKVESMIGNFDGREFSNQFRRNVTLIFPNDPDNPDVKIPIDYGPQQPEIMRCKLIGKGGITCTTQDKKTKSYKKS